MRIRAVRDCFVRCAIVRAVPDYAVQHGARQI